MIPSRDEMVLVLVVCFDMCKIHFTIWTAVGKYVPVFRYTRSVHAKTSKVFWMKAPRTHTGVHFWIGLPRTASAARYDLGYGQRVSVTSINGYQIPDIPCK